MKVTLPHAKNQAETLRTLKAAFILKLSPEAILLTASFMRRGEMIYGEKKSRYLVSLTSTQLTYRLFATQGNTKGLQLEHSATL